MNKEKKVDSFQKGDYFFYKINRYQVRSGSYSYMGLAKKDGKREPFVINAKNLQGLKTKLKTKFNVK